jgi:hypothetical protein
MAVQASNGVAHQIGGVLLPAFVGRNICVRTTLQADPYTFGTQLMHLFIEAAGLADTMPGWHGVTFLTLTNDAIPFRDSQEYLLAAGNEDILSAANTLSTRRSTTRYLLFRNVVTVQIMQGENVVFGLIFDSAQNTQNMMVCCDQATRLGERLT